MSDQGTIRGKGSIIFFFNGSFVNREDGAQWRACSALRFLIREGFDVAVYSYRNYAVRPWEDADVARFAAEFPQAKLHLEDQSRAMKLVAKAKKFASGLFPGLTPWLLRLSLPGLTPVYRRLRVADSGRGSGAVFVNYATGTLDLNGIDPDTTIVDTHDLLFVQFGKRTGRCVFAARVLQKFRSEMSLLAACAGTIGIATADTALFRLCLGDARVLFIPDFATMSTGPSQAVGLARNMAGGRLLFVGSDNPFNVAGLTHFMATQPELVERFGLDVAGKVSRHSDVATAARGLTGVHLMGYVEDLDALYAEARAVISPVDGTGIKIKVLEALAAGVPVFGSAHSIQGLPPGHEACVFPIDDAMAAVLGDSARLETASGAARAWSIGLGDNPDLATLATMLRRAATGAVAASR